MKKENIYIVVWKMSFLSGNVLLALSILCGWISEVLFAISGLLLFLVPFICRMNISEEMKSENYIMEREESEACMNKIKELLEQFEDEKE